MGQPSQAAGRDVAAPAAGHGFQNHLERHADYAVQLLLQPLHRRPPLHAGLVQATDGNFYGTTSAAGLTQGTVFKITPMAR